MQRLIVNCQTGQTEVIELTPEEESDLLKESELTKQLLELQRRVEVKRQLLRGLIELREMKQNRTVFTDEDIAEKEAELDAIRTQF